jgi:hypothetical protein
MAFATTVGTSSVTVIASNSSRKRIWFTNSSSYPAYITTVNPAVVGQGIRLNPHGGYYSTTSQSAWYGISLYTSAVVSGDQQ